MDRPTRATRAIPLIGGLLLTLAGPAAAQPKPAAQAPPRGPSKPAAAAPASQPGPPSEFKAGPPAPLKTEEDARRGVRGDTEPPIVPNESEELRELRRFEEETFPRAERVWGRPAPPLREGTAPAPRSRPTGADAQPGDLRTPPPLRPPLPPPPQPPEWFKKLKLPNLPVRWDPKVQAYLDWFKGSRSGRAVMRRWLTRQGRFRPLIEVAARRNGLPTDIMYVAMIESGYEPTVVSRVGATGMWQFMARTGKVYGLEADHWHDDRRDPERATEAAMHFWKDLYTRFGSWHLALAGYHAGYASILKSILAYNTNDYWELCRHENGLPHETTLYVPKALAAAIIGANREAFGFGDVRPDPSWEFEKVRVPNSTSLGAIARAAGVREGDLVTLNPELRRGRTPPQPWDVRVPRGSAERFARNWATTRKEHDRSDTYVVRFGERLDDVAARYKTSVKELRKLNGIEDSAEVRAGLIMLVPRRTPEELKKAEAERAEEETVVAVPDKDAKADGRERIFYRVRDGDALPEIARFFKVTLEDLGRWNAIDITVKVQPGMVLQLFVAKELDRSKVLLVDAAKVKPVTLGSQAFLEHVALQRGRNRVVYVCRKGDTLERVGRRFNLTVGQMARINQMPRGTDLKPGQKIVVYAPDKKAAAAAPKAQARKAPHQRGREPARQAAPTRGKPAKPAAPARPGKR
ncbi:MAG: LysM peptidoglycan-binding domain-containing protein [Deltaproteobacteria bacterium]|nr:LysM peptidoglycan-binding domain-containing protein [Deltaproteobacteria bacterium]